MTRFLLGTATLIVVAGAANAADLPIKMPMKAPPPVVGYDWNGFYVGGYYGSSVGETKARTDLPGTAGTNTGQVGFNDMGTTLGGTFGYNWQFAPRWLVGLEGDVGTLGVDRTFKEWNDVIISGAKADWYGTVRARFGYVTGPSVLYITGGAAFVNVTDTFGGDSVSIPAVASTTTKTGWTVGGGIETKLSRNWSTKTEYLYIDAGSNTFGSNPFGVAGTPTTFDHTYHVIKTGLNYKLDGNWEGFPLFNTPLLPSNHNWGGVYAGVNIGVGMSLVRAMDVGTPTRGEENVNGAGFSGGGQIGYNYMLTPRWFVGAEGDIGYLGIHGSVTDWFDTSDRFEAKTNWYATARARFGSSTGPALLYITAGGAWVNLQDGFAPTTPPFPGDLATRTASGWTIGGGTEVAINSQWSAKLESLYIDVGHRNHSDTIPAPFFADFKERFMVVRAGLNFKFGGGDVISTRY